MPVCANRRRVRMEKQTTRLLELAAVLVNKAKPTHAEIPNFCIFRDMCRQSKSGCVAGVTCCTPSQVTKRQSV